MYSRRTSYRYRGIYLEQGRDGQHDFYRYHWAIHQHGKLLLQGFDTSGLNDEGKIQLVIGFFGEFSID